MRHLRALADVGVLQLDERARLRPRAQHRARAQVRERADRHAVVQLGVDDVRVEDRDVLAEPGVDERRRRADPRAGADARRAAQDRHRLEHRVAADLDVRVHVGRRGVDHGDPGEHVRLEDAALQERADLGEGDAVVHPEHDLPVLGDVRPDAAAVAAQDRHGVGQVQLALRVVGAQPPERVVQRRGVEGVDARVDLGDGQLLGRRVALRLRLDDPRDVAVGVADDPPVAPRVRVLGAQQRRGGAAGRVRVDERLQRRPVDERRVARQDEHGALPGERVRRRLHRAAGPVRDRLHRRLHPVAEASLEQPLGPLDDHDAVRPRLTRRRDRPSDQRPATELVQDLRQVRAHPCSLTRGQDHCGEGGHARHRRLGGRRSRRRPDYAGLRWGVV